ncbi:MAG TPA: DUF6600 domain-containing protein [Rudaea sp.]|nr:DUF6600 domain-containing protein [Rudaea sp.]
MYTKQRLLALLIGAALAFSAGAQAPNDRGPYDSAPGASLAAAPGQLDPPARVARLSDMSGNVSFTPAGENDWVQAQLNRPIVTGDRLWIADGGRAELQVGASTVRLDNGSNFDFLNLNDQMAQMELTQGTLNINVRRLHGDEVYEVDTPTIAFVASRVGDYRIDVDPQSGFTTVTAWRGGGDAIGEGGKRVAIAEGQTVRFNDSQLVDYQVNQIRARDDFDRYASTRDERYERAPARNYVSEDVVGYQDLDQYGSWEDAPEYGHVWYPSSVSADWAPYHDGHWVWVDPWGWTWVDDAPWGFAPFHYGRWAYVGSRWGWVPGPYDVAPVYSPALVAFVGGGGFGLSVSVGGPIGWFALGPGDVYFPGYRCGRDYFNRVNVGNTYINHTVVNNYYGSWSNGSVNYSQLTYANRNAPRAMTAVQSTAFVSGRPVASSAIAVNRTTMANARVMPRAMVAPTQASLVAGRGRAAAPPSTVMNRTVVAAHTPPPQTPSFAQRQPALQKSAGQPLSVNQMHTLAAQTNGRNANATAANVRVVNRAGAASPARPMAAQTPGSAASNGNARGPQQSPSGRSVDRSVANGNGNAPSSHVRSADFVHPGGQQNNAARTSTAQSARGETNNLRSTPNDNRGRQATNAARDNQRGNPAETTAQQSRIRSSTFAHGTSSGQNAISHGAETRQQQQRATAAAAPSTRNAEARNNESVRGNASAARNTNHVAPETGPSMTQRSESASRSRSNFNMPQNSRSTAATTRESRQPTPALSRAPTESRASEQHAPNYRAEQQRASPQNRASEQRVQQPAPSARPSYTQRAPEQRSAPPAQQHSAPAYTQRAPEQRSAPVQRSAPQQQRAPAQAPPQAVAQHSPPPPPQQQQQQQHAPQRQTSVARQAPQHAPKDNEKDKKKDNGGGGG